MRRQLLGGTLSVCLFAATAGAATLHPAVEAQLSTGSGDEPISVIAYLEEAPIATLDAQLQAERATRLQRHTTIVNALQAQQQTQAPFKAWLDQAMLDGKVLGYTSYWITNAIVIQATKETIREIERRADVEQIELNWQAELIEPVSQPNQDHGELGAPGQQRLNIVPPGIRAINADRVWYELGFDGTGALIAGLDTGVDGNHPALASRWRGLTRPASEAWLDVLGSSQFPSDSHGHGTHTMGTMTGRSSTTFDTVGVAWGAEWIACNAINQGVGGEFDNDVINAFQWFMNPDGNLGTVSDVPDVVQNSWGINEGFPGGYTDCDIRWWNVMDNCEAAGVVIVFSAGNEGPGAQSHRSPADRATTAHNAFSVGAVDATNFDFPYPIAGFSSRGPTGCNVPAALKIKPEVAAPGVDVYSSVPGGGYSSAWSGTSMAGPHVSGTVALMRQANPDLSVTDIKQILMDTAIDHGTAGEDNTYGWGVIDAFAAVQASMSGFGSLEGFVGNGSFGDAPISGATVTALEAGREFGTDISGSYSGSIPAGVYTLEATHPSFAPQQFQVEVVDGELTVQDFSLTDIAGPSITNVTNRIATTNTAGPYSIQATITDFSTVVEASLYYRINDGTWSSLAMFGFGTTYGASLPGLPAGSKIDYYVSAEDGVGLISTNPEGAPAEFYTLYITEVSYRYDAEAADANWALSATGDNATSGRWVRENPVGTNDSGNPIQTEDDHTPAPGVTCFVTGNTPVGGAAGDNDVDNGCTSLVSPVFDLSDASLAFVSYARWFQMGGAASDDVFEVYASSNNGSTWVSLESVTQFAPAWREVTLRVDEVVQLTSQVRFKWVACDINTQGLTEAAVDDFQVEVFRPNTSDAPESASSVLRTVLETNAPNPMATTTSLRFRLSNASDAHLAIYDAAGRLVRNLLDQQLEAGPHEVAWDGTDNAGRAVEAGVYFYRLEAGAFQQSRRLLVVR
jgi:subtilisin family serine protease